MIEATSGVSSFFLSFLVVDTAPFESGVPVIEVGAAISDGKAAASVEGEGGVLVTLLSGLGIGRSGSVLDSTGLVDVELKRKDARMVDRDAC